MDIKESTGTGSGIRVTPIRVGNPNPHGSAYSFIVMPGKEKNIYGSGIRPQGLKGS